MLLPLLLLAAPLGAPVDEELLELASEFDSSEDPKGSDEWVASEVLDDLNTFTGNLTDDLLHLDPERSWRHFRAQAAGWWSDPNSSSAPTPKRARSSGGSAGKQK